MEIILVLGLVSSWALLILGALVLYQLLLQNGRVLIRLDAIEQWLARSSTDAYEVEPYLGALPPGVPAPNIILPDLRGDLRTLAEWRGQRVLLVFFDPECAFCRQLLPSLVALASDPIAERPMPVVVSTGELEANRLLFDDAGFSRPVLLQREMEVAAAFKVDGTPMSYLIEADGTIASGLAAGIQATLILAGEIASVADATVTDHPGDTARQPTDPVVRDGLKEGTPAPVFRLPRLEGGELSLLDYRGKSVVVVFSDPECEPCNVLAPLLEESHLAIPALSLLMISRGNVQSNRSMVAEHGLTFPVALQRHWEISREYGIFATPAAFHIDEWGVVASDVAVGTESIMELVRNVAQDVIRSSQEQNDREIRGVEKHG